MGEKKDSNLNILLRETIPLINKANAHACAHLSRGGASLYVCVQLEAGGVGVCEEKWTEGKGKVYT